MKLKSLLLSEPQGRHLQSYEKKPHYTRSRDSLRTSHLTYSYCFGCRQMQKFGDPRPSFTCAKYKNISHLIGLLSKVERPWRTPEALRRLDIVVTLPLPSIHGERF